MNVTAIGTASLLPLAARITCTVDGTWWVDIFKCIFLNENVWISIKISPKFVSNGPIINIPALVQIMAWRRPGDKTLSEPMMVRSLTGECKSCPRNWALRPGPLTPPLLLTLPLQPPPLVSEDSSLTLTLQQPPPLVSEDSSLTLTLQQPPPLVSGDSSLTLTLQQPHPLVSGDSSLTLTLQQPHPLVSQNSSLTLTLQQPLPLVSEDSSLTLTLLYNCSLLPWYPRTARWPWPSRQTTVYDWPASA